MVQRAHSSFFCRFWNVLNGWGSHCPKGNDLDLAGLPADFLSPGANPFPSLSLSFQRQVCCKDLGRCPAWLGCQIQVAAAQGFLGPAGSRNQYLGRTPDSSSPCCPGDLGEKRHGSHGSHSWVDASALPFEGLRHLGPSSSAPQVA